MWCGHMGCMSHPLWPFTCLRDYVNALNEHLYRNCRDPYNSPESSYPLVFGGNPGGVCPLDPRQKPAEVTTGGSFPTPCEIHGISVCQRHLEEEQGGVLLGAVDVGIANRS